MSSDGLSYTTILSIALGGPFLLALTTMGIMKYMKSRSQRILDSESNNDGAIELGNVDRFLANPENPPTGKSLHSPTPIAANSFIIQIRSIPLPLPRPQTSLLTRKRTPCRRERGQRHLLGACPSSPDALPRPAAPQRSDRRRSSGTSRHQPGPPPRGVAAKRGYRLDGFGRRGAPVARASDEPAAALP
ncbi:hypothetical protein F4781DRAFT_151918 [Annulohypoxylon bovei var. microspora]|nr:hypothetical protein F4781DRAFT_151918 [Annulohypoxylon bovei var. microspora]